MSQPWRLAADRIPASEIARHLRACDSYFSPALSARVDIGAYAIKLAEKAECFSAWSGDRLVGLVAAYFAGPVPGTCFISNVSVEPDWQGKGLASALLARCKARAREMALDRIVLEVGIDNSAAIRLYENNSFIVAKSDDVSATMALTIEKDEGMGTTRNYDIEIKDTADHQYAYGFDFDVMHPYMIRSFEPFFRPGNLLELGSFKGDFTRRFLEHFDDVTCVEASGEALEEARAKLGDRFEGVHATFETVSLPRRYDNIVLTHVLEHLDDPIAVLRRVNEEWLADGGRFFLVCPNANAPSRQIAVKMGLISHNAAVTPAEAEHGHRCTYSLDTLERDAVAAGLKVVHRSGVFFKALANFQWDRLLKTDIISKEYLEGCYELGQQYPDLCSSIFLMCERG